MTSGLIDQALGKPWLALCSSSSPEAEPDTSSPEAEPDTSSPEAEPDTSSPEAAYQYQPVAVEHNGIKQRWLIIYSKAARERTGKHLRKALAKERHSLEKQLFHLQAQRFDTEEEAREALSDITGSYHQVGSPILAMHKEYQKRGRPTDDTPYLPRWQIKASLVVQQALIDQQVEQGACFILGTNIAPDDLDDKAVFRAYKGQSSVEQGFRFLKDPLFFVSSLFVKKPSRVEGLLMVMTLSLLVYSVAQRRLREGLSNTQETIGNQINQPTSSPTLRWVFQLFDGIHRVRFKTALGEVITMIEGLNDLRKKIIALFGAATQRIYHFSSI